MNKSGQTEKAKKPANIKNPAINVAGLNMKE
jgi:hypothetical protein